MRPRAKRSGHPESNNLKPAGEILAATIRSNSSEMLSSGSQADLLESLSEATAKENTMVPNSKITTEVQDEIGKLMNIIGNMAWEEANMQFDYLDEHGAFENAEAIRERVNESIIRISEEVTIAHSLLSKLIE